MLQTGVLPFRSSGWRCTSPLRRCRRALRWCRSSRHRVDFARAAFQLVAPLLQVIGSLVHLISLLVHLISLLVHLIAALGHLISLLVHLIAALGHLIAALGRLISALAHLISLLVHLIAALGRLIAAHLHIVAMPVEPRRTLSSPDRAGAAGDRVTRPSRVRVAVEPALLRATSFDSADMCGGRARSSGGEALAEPQRRAGRRRTPAVRDAVTVPRAMPSVTVTATNDTPCSLTIGTATQRTGGSEATSIATTAASASCSRVAS